MKYLVVLLSLVMSVAYADNDRSNQGNTAVEQGQGQLQGQVQGQVATGVGIGVGVGIGQGGQGGTASSDATASADATSVSAGGAGGSATLNYNNVNPDSIKIRSVPDANAPAIFSANNCALGGSVGASGVGFGISAGGTKESEECRIWEAVRILGALGYDKMAEKAICLSEIAKAANFEYCNDYRTSPEGWGAVSEGVEEIPKDYTQFNK